MSQLFAAFGIDWRLLLVNIINFGLLLTALWYFLYGPLMRMLDSRRQKVAEGVANAEEATRRLAEVEGTRHAVLAQAGKESDEMLAAARAASIAKGRDMLAQSEAAAARVVTEAEAQAQELKAQALRESKQDLAKLVVLGVEKTLAQQK